MSGAIAIVAFAGYLVTAALAGRGHGRRRSTNVFIAWALGASFLAGLTQRDLWPFSAWPLIASTVPDVVEQRRVQVIDEAGTAWDVDYRAWSPLSYAEMLAWVDAGFMALDPDDRRAAATHLVQHFETARLDALERGRLVRRDGHLGPLNAPFFLLHPRPWDGDGLPTTPLVGLRYQVERWDLMGRAGGSDSVVVDVRYELRSIR